MKLVLFEMSTDGLIKLEVDELQLDLFDERKKVLPLITEFESNDPRISVDIWQDVGEGILSKWIACFLLGSPILKPESCSIEVPKLPIKSSELS